MNANDYCSCELSKKLKECGFDEPCREYYTPDKERRIVKNCALSPEIINNRYLEEIDDGCCTAVSLWQAQKWLRDEKNIVVIAEPDFDQEVEDGSDFLTGKWYFTVWKDGERIHCNFNPNSEVEEIWMFDKYEDALSAGIKAALELLGKEVEK